MNHKANFAHFSLAGCVLKVNICSPVPHASTDPRIKLLAFLQKLEDSGYPPPSIREVAGKLGFKSSNAASKLIHRMQHAGEVLYQPGRARSLRLARPSDAGVPLFGSIAAGFPDSLDALPAERLQLDPASFGIRNPSDAFALRVRGESMIGRNFFNGDLVILDRSAKAKNHDVVAALIDQECTLKTLVIENGKTWLKAENPAYPSLLPVFELQIQGVAKAVIHLLAA